MKNNFKTFGKLISVLMIGVLLFCAFAVGISAAVTATAETFISSDTMDFENGYSGRINTKYALVDGDTGKAMKLTIGSKAENWNFELTNNSGTALTLNDGKVYAVSVSYKVDRIGGDDKQAPTIINLVRTTESGDGIVKVKNFPDAAFYVGDTTDWVTSTVVFKASVASAPEFNRIAINVVSSSCPSTLSTAEENTTVVQFDNISVTECTENTKSIDFYSNGGSYCEPVLAQEGEAITLPTPTRDLYDFAGWYTDINLTSAFKKTAMPGDLITKLYAKWKIAEDSVRLSYVTNNGETVADAVGREGDAVTLPRLTRDGFHFAGWYDKSYKTRYEYTAFPAESTTLYAKWEVIPRLCNFDNADVFPEPNNGSFTKRCELTQKSTYRGSYALYYDFWKGYPESKGQTGYARVILRDEVGEYIRVQKGKTYTVSFKYKAMGAENRSYLGVLTSSKGSAWSAHKEQIPYLKGHEFTNDVGAGWKTCTLTFTAEPITDNDNYLSIGIGGVAQIYVDEILVYEYDSNFGYKGNYMMLAFDTQGGPMVDTVYAERDTEVTLPKLEREGYRFIGWCYDSEYMKPVESETIKLDKAFILLYADWYKIPPVTEAQEPEPEPEPEPEAEPVVEPKPVENGNTALYIIIAVAAAAVIAVAVVVIAVVKKNKKKSSEQVQPESSDNSTAEPTDSDADAKHDEEEK